MWPGGHLVLCHRDLTMIVKALASTCQQEEFIRSHCQQHKGQPLLTASSRTTFNRLQDVLIMHVNGAVILLAQLI